MAAVKAQGSTPFLLLDAWKRTQIAQAQLNSGIFHRLFRVGTASTLRRGDWLPNMVEHSDPICDKAAFAQFVSVEILGQSRLAATACAMPHDYDFLDAQELYGKLECGGNAMLTSGRFEWRHQGSNVPDDKYLAGTYIENL